MFEAHWYLLMCVERHQVCVEKYRERVLDLCDNVSQSSAMEALARTVETLPVLLHVGLVAFHIQEEVPMGFERARPVLDGDAVGKHDVISHSFFNTVSFGTSCQQWRQWGL